MTNRTAVYGPVRTVVWEGRRSDPSPYPDLDSPPHIESHALSRLEGASSPPPWLIASPC